MVPQHQDSPAGCGAAVVTRAAPNHLVVRAAALLVLAGSVWITLVALRHLGQPFVTHVWWQLGALAAVTVAALLVVRWTAGTHAFPTCVWLGGCVVAFVATRLLALWLLRSEPVSDFQSYWSLAQRFATGLPLPPESEARLFVAWGWPLLMAPVVHVFGAALWAAKLLNVLLATATLPAIYVLARQVGGVRTAQVASVLFVLWPAEWALTPVLASEHPALLFALVYLLVLTRRVQCRATGWELAAGALALGVAVAVRPALGILLPLGLVFVWAYERGRRRVVGVALLATVFVGSQLGYLALLRTAYGRTPPTVAWWNLMVGLNYDTGGQWNAADAHRFAAHATLAERNAIARDEIVHRATSQPWRHPQLIRRKVRTLWGDGYYGLYWATHEMADTSAARWTTRHLPQLYAAAQVAHILGGLACAGALLTLLRRRVANAGFTPARVLLLGLILCGTLVHAVFESQARYCHVFALGALIFAAYALVPASVGGTTTDRTSRRGAP